MQDSCRSVRLGAANEASAQYGSAELANPHLSAAGHTTARHRACYLRPPATLLIWRDACPQAHDTTGESMNPVILLAVLAMTALASGVVHAEGTMVWATYGHALSQGTGSDGLTPTSPDQPTHATLGWWDGPHSAIVTGNARFGAADASGLVSSTQAGTVKHFIFSGFADEITLVRPDLAGQAGRITLSFYYEGRAMVFAGDGAQVSVNQDLSAYVNNAQGSIMEDMVDGESAGHRKWAYVNDVNGEKGWHAPFEDRYLTMTADFTWGQPVLFGLTVGTSGYSDGYSGHDVSFRGSWGGIVEATAGGAAVADYSLSSLSGTDYTRSFVSPVPEPAAFALMTGGLGALVLRVAGRRAAFAGYRFLHCRFLRRSVDISPL